MSKSAIQPPGQTHGCPSTRDAPMGKPDAHFLNPCCRRPRRTPHRPHRPAWPRRRPHRPETEEHTSELQSLMRTSYAVFCLKKKKTTTTKNQYQQMSTYTKIQYKNNHNHCTTTN